MALKSYEKGPESVNRLVACPYCDEPFHNTKPSSHFPCDETPTTDEVIAALEARGIR